MWLVAYRWVLARATLRDVQRDRRPNQHDIARSFFCRSHQVETRCCASIPLIYGHQTSAPIAAVKGLEAQAREFWRAVNEINHSQMMLKSPMRGTHRH
jgi:hypothetical protein